MQYRRLGREGPTVSAVGLGAMSFASVYGSAEDAESEATVGPRPGARGHIHRHRQHLRGGTAARRSSAGPSLDAAPMSCSPPNSAAVAAPASGGATRCALRSRRALPASAPTSVDVYYLHRVDPSTPIEETVGAMANLVSAGLVRYLGSPRPRPRPSAGRRPPIRSPHSRPSIRCSAASRRSMRSFRPRASSASGSSRTARSAAACLPDTSNVSRISRRMTGGGACRAGRRRTSSTTSAPGEPPRGDGPAPRHSTTAQLALARVLHAGEDIVPIPGTRKRQNLEANAAVADVTLASARGPGGDRCRGMRRTRSPGPGVPRHTWNA